MGDEKTIPPLVFTRRSKAPSSTSRISGFGREYAPGTQFGGASRFQERPPEPVDRLRLDLAHSFARDAESATQFLERAKALFVQPEPGDGYAPFAGRKSVEQTGRSAALDVAKP